MSPAGEVPVWTRRVAVAVAAILLAAACVIAGAKLGGTGATTPSAIATADASGGNKTDSDDGNNGSAAANGDAPQVSDTATATAAGSAEPVGSNAGSAPVPAAAPESAGGNETGTFKGVIGSKDPDVETGEMTGDLTGGDKSDAPPTEAPAPDAPSSLDEPADDELLPTWKLAWADEFDGDTINAANWSHQNDCWGGGNNERQCYTSSPNNSWVKNGKLHIKAIKEEVSGCDNQNGSCPPGNIVTRQYSSARLRTINKRDFKYGRIEFRAKLPGGKGIWPALWMMPTQSVFGGWARSGEIDVMEAVNLDTTAPQGCGGGPQPCGNRLHGTIHYGGACCGANRQNTGYVNPAWDMTESFNTYGIEWRERQIRWFINGNTYRTLNQTAVSCAGANPPGCVWYTTESTDPAAPFNQTFHLIMNLAVGGNWPGDPDDSTTFPQELIVDYVRVYQCSSGLPTGAGCS